jgi:hypothetical protein
MSQKFYFVDKKIRKASIKNFLPTELALSDSVELIDLFDGGLIMLIFGSRF